MSDDTLGDWAYALRPDFVGPMTGGRYGCLLSWTDPEGEWMWAFGYGPDAVTAREAAIQHIIEQRFQAFLLPHLNGAH